MGTADEAGKMAADWWLNNLGEIATKHEAHPDFMNELGYCITKTETGTQFDPGKWYIPYGKDRKTYMDFRPNADTAVRDIQVASHVLNDKALVLTEDSRSMISFKLAVMTMGMTLTWPDALFKIDGDDFIRENLKSHFGDEVIRQFDEAVEKSV